jgi:hypothetical protein
MSLKDYEDFVFNAVHAHEEDPIAYWNSTAAGQQKAIDFLAGKDVVTLRGPNVDLTLSIKGRKFMNSTGTYNMPSGEIFTGPVEDSVNGWVRFSYPSIYWRARRVRHRTQIRAGQGGQRDEPSRTTICCKHSSTPTLDRAIWASSPSARTSASRSSPAISCSTRKSAGPCTWRIGMGYPRDRQQELQRRPLGHDLRHAH